MPPADSLEDQAARAVAGDRDALNTVAEALRDPIYGLCLRMLGSVPDAADATQEILIRIVTRLSSFRGDSRLTTWAYRIAVNYIADLRRRPQESITFERVEALLAQPANEIDAKALQNASPELLTEETFLGCTLGLLRCLDREHRLAFILGAIVELEGREAAQILEISPAAFRKRLSRARQRLEAFMRPRCGEMNPEAPCRCRHQVNANVERGLVDPANLRLTRGERRRVREHIGDVRSVIGAVELFQRHPDYPAPAGVVHGLRRLLHSGVLPIFH